MHSDDSSDEENFDPEQIVRYFDKEAQLLMNNLLPQKSQSLYIKTYNDFMEWKNKNSASFDENVFLVYFEELFKDYKPPTLWSIWSKLKCTLSVKERIDLDKYNLLKTTLKNKSKGYKSKKSKILTLSQIKQFLDIAEDNIYLAMKVILLFGFFGALRCQEIINMKTTDVQDVNKQFIIAVNETKTYLNRNFIIANEYYDTVKKYMSLRPDGMIDRFFVTYHNGKCSRQFIGKNKISEIPSIIAAFLQLPEPEKYTGHCYRRSSATALSNTGADLVKVKNHGGWKSDSVAQGYIDFSTANRRQIFDIISNSSSVSNNDFSKRPPINTVYVTSNVPTKLCSSSREASGISDTSMKRKDIFIEKSNVPSTSKAHDNVHDTFIDDKRPPIHIVNASSTVPTKLSTSTKESGGMSDTSTDKTNICIEKSNVPSTSQIHNDEFLTVGVQQDSIINDVNEYVSDETLDEPHSKRRKYNSTNGIKNQELEKSLKPLFQNCEIRTLNINYYCSCKNNSIL